MRTFERTAARATLAVLVVLAGPAASQIVFEPPVLGPAGDGGGVLSAHRLVVHDVTGDGAPDVLVVTGLGGPVSFMPNDGAGNLEPPVAVPDLASSSTVSFADLDGDGHEDMLGSKSLEVWVKRGLGAGAYAPAQQVTSFGQASGGLLFAAADVTGDDVPDLVLSRNTGLFQPTHLEVLAGLGDGTFGPPVVLHTSGFFDSHGVPRAGDLDDDGRNDLVTTAEGLQLFLPAGDDVLEEVRLPHDVKLARLADLDHRGGLDVVALGDDPGTLVIVLGVADGSYEQRVLTVGADLQGLVLRDLDDDGWVDIAATGTDARTIVLRNLTGGVFAPDVTITNAFPARALEAGDLDGDGRVDLVAVGATQFVDALEVMTNHTYRDDEPFTDLGEACPGSRGFPVLLAEGTLLGGDATELRLANGPQGSASWLVVGSTAVNAGFAGGVMVPSPDRMIGPVVLNGAGRARLVARWPHDVPSGEQLWLQWWIADARSRTGYAATSAVRIDTP